MRLRILASISMAVGVLATTIGVAGPASGAPAAWVMPDVVGSVLQPATKAVYEATGSAKLNLKLLDLRNGQEVINKTNWVVCYTNPKAGATISQKSKRVSLFVKRFNQKYCHK